MKITNSQTVTSLLTALFFVVAFILTGCSADTLTGPDLGPETTIQADGDGGGAHHNTGNKNGNNSNNGNNGNNSNGGGAHHNTGNGG